MCCAGARCTRAFEMSLLFGATPDSRDLGLLGCKCAQIGRSRCFRLRPRFAGGSTKDSGSAGRFKGGLESATSDADISLERWCDRRWPGSPSDCDWDWYCIDDAGVSGGSCLIVPCDCSCDREETADGAGDGRE